MREVIEQKVLWKGDDYQNCLRIIGGRFYTHGFFPDGSDPYRTDLPWAAMKEAAEFLDRVVGILNDGDCRSLGSAGDRRYYPFLCIDEQMAYIPGFLTQIESRMPGFVSKSLSLTKRSCLFWSKGREPELKEYLEPKTIRAFKQASKLMKENLKNRIEFAVVQAPERMELPVFIGGQFAPGIFAGLFTTAV